MRELSVSTEPGQYLADLIPFLTKIPVFLQTWRARAQKSFERQKDIWMKYWTGLSRDIEAERAPPCFAKELKDKNFEREGITELQSAFLAGSKLLSPVPATMMLISHP
jgi:hypothetical protein